MSHWVSASHSEEEAWPDVCCYGPIVSLQGQEFISPVNSHYVKEDAIHPATPALGFHLDYQRASANPVLRPHQIKIYETRYEGMEGGGGGVKRESKWGQRTEEAWDFFFLFVVGLIYLLLLPVVSHSRARLSVSWQLKRSGNVVS